MGIISKCGYAAKSTIKAGFLKLRTGGRFSCGKLPYFKGKTLIELSKGSKVTIGRNLKTLSGGRIGVRENAELKIGDQVSVNVGTMITCHDSITIGSYTQIGPYCQILDHDHRYDSVEAFDNQEFKTAPVVIGEHCWIGANCVIMRGTVIGDNCVVGAGSVIKGNFPANSLIYNKRETEVRTIVKSKG